MFLNNSAIERLFGASKPIPLPGVYRCGRRAVWAANEEWTLLGLSNEVGVVPWKWKWCDCQDVAMGQNQLYHIWVVIHIHKSHLFWCSRLGYHGFDPWPCVLLIMELQNSRDRFSPNWYSRDDFQGTTTNKDADFHGFLQHFTSTAQMMDGRKKSCNLCC